MRNRRGRRQKGNSLSPADSSTINPSSAKLNSSFSSSGTTVASVEKHAFVTTQKAQDCDMQKEAGNKLFQAGDYQGAVVTYVKAISEFGGTPALLSNLAAAYLNLELFQEAEEAATAALERDPCMFKARYRRGLARKGQMNLIEALRDFKSVVQQDPTCVEAIEQLEGTRDLHRALTFSFDSDSDDDDPIHGADWPPFDIVPPHLWDSDDDFDANESRRLSSHIPCRFYNHDGCSKSDCRYSHAPGDKSVRDELGKNVCLYFLLDQCKFGLERCVYCHDKTHLPPGWWDDMEATMYLKSLPYEEINSYGRKDLDELLTTSSVVLGGFAIGECIAHTGLAIVNDQEDEPITASSTASNHSSANLAAEKRFISLMILDVDTIGEGNYPAIEALKDRILVRAAKSPRQAIAHLKSPDLAGVFVADGALLKPQNSWVLSKLMEYTGKGGCVVMGGLFSSRTRPIDMAAFFSRSWGVGWKPGAYRRVSFTLNTKHELAKRKLALPDSYSMRALCVEYIEPDCVLYSQTSLGRLQSPAVQVRFGEGHMGYIGDIDWEDESTILLLAMLRLSILEPTRSPFVIVCSFGHEDIFSKTQKNLLDALRSRADVLHGLSNERVVDLLGSQDLIGVLVTDQALVKPRNAYLLVKLIEFVKSGGTVVLGGQFAAHCRFDKLGPFFQNFWGLPWTCGSYTKCDTTVNVNNQLMKNGPGIPRNCYMKALHISGVAPEMAVYLPDKGTGLYSPGTELKQTPVACAQVGQGRLGYIGDVGLQDEHTQIVLALFGLLK